MASWLWATVACALCLYALQCIWWKPRCLSAALRRQGIKGKTYIPVIGNIIDIGRMRSESFAFPMELAHAIMPRIVPYFCYWSKLYGEQFFYWWGSQLRFVVRDPTLVRGILLQKNLSKPTPWPALHDLFGARGLVMATGETWSRHRKIIKAAFQADAVDKLFIPVVMSSTSIMLNNWKDRNNVDVLQEFHSLLAEIFAKAGFGSSYEEAREIFELQSIQQRAVMDIDLSVFFPSYRWVPTPKNIYKWKVKRAIEKKIYAMIEKRLQNAKTGYGTDLLGILVSANAEGRMSLLEVMEECKTFFISGHETMTVSLTWTFMLLALHGDWQTKARKEVMEVCGALSPTAESITQFTNVGMIFKESLRLYPPVVSFFRYATSDLRVENIVIPKGTSVEIPVVMMMHASKLWGKDFAQFNPLRFANGNAQAASHPMAFIPFASGERNCIGQGFTTTATSLIIAAVLQKFSLKLSPEYKHAPVHALTIRPSFGMPILLEPVNV